MSTKQLKEALRKHREHEAAQRAERITVPGYPYSHDVLHKNGIVPQPVPGKYRHLLTKTEGR